MHNLYQNAVWLSLLFIPDTDFFSPKHKKSESYSIKKLNICSLPVAHACNPSYSAGRDQEDHGSKPAQADSL
jgi:hypothetical protein